MKATLFSVGYVLALGTLSLATLWCTHVYFRLQQQSKHDIARMLLFLGFLGFCLALPIWLLSLLFKAYQGHIGTLVRVASFITWLGPTVLLALAKTSVKGAPIRDPSQTRKGPFL